MANSSLVLFFFLSVVATSSLAFCPYGVDENTVTSSDIKDILALHNQIRFMVTMGNIPGQPRGVNLRAVKWDPALAQAAQSIANTCEFEHVNVSDKRWGVGQNLYTKWSSSDTPGADWQGVMQRWFNEYKDYKYPIYSSKTAHYNQIIWADTKYVGCGYSYFKDRKGGYRKLYVCNYGPGAMSSKPPYKTA